MKYTTIFLVLATISCSQENKIKEVPKKDTVIIDYLRGTNDTLIYTTVQLDTVEVKKKPVKNQYISKCVACKISKTS